ncbi:MAG: phytanoyl-CoA dioxygenase family protein [Bacteroidia bacterium]|nr:phytanoyl-CoA dioxygenase family protein [Bacteroidia bacterium]
MPDDINELPVRTLNTYKNWKPVFHSVVKNQALAQTLHEKGYAVLPFLNTDQIKQLKQLYANEHNIKAEKGAMFYTLYSKDHAYRKRIHENIGEIIKPLFEEHFKDYKNVINIFINKISGQDSGFYTHQDTTALDEFTYSPLSIWIPLQDITPENGALGVIEKSHWFFSPYRGISFPFPFSKINDTVKDYLKPIYLKAGEALIFDPRIVHNSFTNTAGSDRIVALCGIFPKDAELITCFKEKVTGSKIELIKQEDSFLLKNESFFYDCHSRPKTGKTIAIVEEEFPDMDSASFEQLCELNGIEKGFEQQATISHCEFIAEPNGVNSDITSESDKRSSFFQKLKSLIG